MDYCTKVAFSELAPSLMHFFVRHARFCSPQAYFNLRSYSVKLVLAALLATPMFASATTNSLHNGGFEIYSGTFSSNFSTVECWLIQR